MMEPRHQVKLDLVVELVKIKTQQYKFKRPPVWRSFFELGVFEVNQFYYK